MSRPSPPLFRQGHHSCAPIRTSFLSRVVDQPSNTKSPLAIILGTCLFEKYFLILCWRRPETRLNTRITNTPQRESLRQQHYPIMVTIFGYSGSFAANPDVKIYKEDGSHIATISKNGRITIPITESCELLFKVSIRSTKTTVKPGDSVLLDFDTKSGKLLAHIMNEEEAAAAQEKKIKESDSTLKVWIKALFDIFVG